MRSEAQREQSRVNGAKSRGPKTPEGKNKTRFNGLRHGLRSDQVVLPGESVAEFQAELKGWKDDWRPASHTAAVLVERAAIASWRLRRCVRAESDLLMDLAVRAAEKRRGDDEIDDDEAEALADRDDERLRRDPAGALAELRSSAEGVDRLLSRWDELAEVLDGAPEDWRGDGDHGALMNLLGHDRGGDPALAGPAAEDSRRLLRSNKAQYIADRLPDDEAEAIADRLRAAVARQREALRELRRELVGRESAAPAAADGGGAGDADLKFLGVSRRVLLLHRYEMAHERSMRAAMKDLIALEKARPAPGRAADEETEIVSEKRVKEERPATPSRPEPGTPPAPSEPGGSVAPARSVGPRRVPEGGRPRGSRRRRKGRSPG